MPFTNSDLAIEMTCPSELWVSSKRIAKEATLCCLSTFEQICFSIQVSDLSAQDLVVVIVAQKVKDPCIEDERQYRAPHLPARLLIAAMS
ncbi:chromatin modification-related protein eaf-1-like [Dorcoceras hygrometricum]|uniref:Chromatin modification-related protein eaf-1-like n=1 Tax=Dorcoceras hygrometricum TaxID=472368 RepID=A0A2Z7DCF0_9LAMI|nr:chromatin modification-related protein eaf-1-like [Dorcoceras hygrometricum]